jgi:hypothetical protein
MNLINHDLKTIFIHVLKNGGTFTSNALIKFANFDVLDYTSNPICFTKNNFGRAVRLLNILEADYTMANTQDYNKIAFTRNPYTKFVSGFSFVTSRKKRPCKFDQIENNTLLTLNDLIQNIDIVNDTTYNHTFLSQTKMLYLNGQLQITQLCRFENMRTELQNIFNNFNPSVIYDLDDPTLKQNASCNKTPFYEYYDEASFNFVNTWFADDFANFNYTKFDTFQDFINFYQQQASADQGLI